MIVLGIETSCDESAVAIVDDNKNILSNIIFSQVDLHKAFGGVIPELSARSHLEVIDNLIIQALDEAKLDFKDIDGFGATCGPGLIGSVIVGMACAKTLSAIFNKPFLAVNHLEGHALTARLTNNIEFPYLLLLVSGGHCQILIAKGLGDYEKIGETIDDALGEAFDKVAQMLGMQYPGGPEIEKYAKKGDAKRFKFPKPLIDAKNHQKIYDFSFSGLKTAVRREIEKITGEDFSYKISSDKIDEKTKADISASFQNIVAEILINRLQNVVQKHPYFSNKTNPLIKNLVLAGGVSANKYLISSLENFAQNNDLKIVSPPLKLCTDNASMIAWVGIEKLQNNSIDSLDFVPKARWYLDKPSK
ncbi:MAG: tRNA (adenosine(37)-N6)-threonylcarbamoyltransferase complex transferase subunit TsaD [Proteobacteria bacterium]|nr:tRNA (adenosine(37)-N6)-threonylcarbamoyltransferase complex transferase subunit TsaD [Pseudomonadota bacterium]NCA27924.1 tRNA (adenosine(37)-N6)-threonylcarbamoyltransferase complex transferase subunit TsaD [Pseudomonadota bacterium]